MTQQQTSIISSDDTIQNFDSHIKISAGPGAGKTTWLAGHISHVAGNSKRLHKAARIACISYTNAASETIRAKLGQCADIVDTSTIHSFLFANLVRPYIHMLTDENGQCLFESAPVQNHYPPNPTYHQVDQWLDKVGVKNKRDINNNKAYQYLKRTVWHIQGDGMWACQPIDYTDHPKYMPTTKVGAYKELLWKKGILEHDDVLYLAYIILEEHRGNR
ncbi:MAG: AAA family ATPase [Chloroflexi bacterium]|nr:AAA family ATPase [Chloroflexota bacterium]